MRVLRTAGLWRGRRPLAGDQHASQRRDAACGGLARPPLPSDTDRRRRHPVFTCSARPLAHATVPAAGPGAHRCHHAWAVGPSLPLLPRLATSCGCGSDACVPQAARHRPDPADGRRHAVSRWGGCMAPQSLCSSRERACSTSPWQPPPPPRLPLAPPCPPALPPARSGRGVDQILPHHCDPVLYESCVQDARGYVQLATAANGPLPAERPAEYPWGVALRDMQARRGAGAGAGWCGVEGLVPCTCSGSGGCRWCGGVRHPGQQEAGARSGPAGPEPGARPKAPSPAPPDMAAPPGEAAGCAHHQSGDSGDHS